MSLNIKNPQVHELARAVARRTGTTQTSAIEVALRRYLDELEAGDQRIGEEQSARVDRILADMRLRLKAAPNALDTDVLYDQQGLPA